MGEIVTIVISASAGAVVMSLLFWRGYSFRAKEFSFPFVKGDLSRFDGLSAVTFFREISIRALNPSEAQEAAAAAAASDASPVFLIHSGWNLVCEAFVRRFQAYPDDERITGAASAIGGQNVEFVRTYRDIHVNAVRYARQVTPEFAANYLLRAPSLAERIEGPNLRGMDPRTRSLVQAASRIIQGDD
ncbi:MAG TPA: hypothetical protein VMS43_01480 [Allosphingosinicella sp.]|nr:hypothetical protein [Allosphingosinicella sp.]